MSARRSDVDYLIDQLDRRDGGAEEAEASLQAMGPVVVEPLLERLHALTAFGRRCAVDVLREIGDTRAGPALTELLADEDEVVREWAAQAVGELGVTGAVPELKRLYDETKVRGVPPDWTLPVSARRALTRLGARDEVTPATVAELAERDEALGRSWLPARLPEVVSELAAASQVVLYFQYWKPLNGTHTAVDTPSWEIDWSRPWPDLVERARQGALDAIRRAGTPRGTLATMEWIAETDWR